MKNLLTPDEALNIILERTAVLPPETPEGSAAEKLEFVRGRVLAADVVSPSNLPPFDNSAMDGYAVQAADLAETASPPVTLKLLETIGAGEVARAQVVTGSCLKIMTGAPVPGGANAVVMREDTVETPEGVQFLTSIAPGRNIRLAGSDVRIGETVLRQGTRLDAASWSMLAALGVYEVPVYPRPRVAIIVTGEELAAPGQELNPGQIHESNSFALRALAEESGADVVSCRRSGDTTAEFAAILAESTAMADVVITSGGVSAGDFDPVRDVLHEQATVHFWKVAMKPGKPVLFANYQNTPIFGLPGNPVSVMVAFEVFVRPALLKMGGHRQLHRLQLLVRAADDFHSITGRTEFVRASVHQHADGWTANFHGDQGSGRLSTMVGANALLVVPAEVAAISAGDTLWARLLR